MKVKNRKYNSEKCPELRATLVGDETYYFCTLIDKICFREYGYRCEEYENWLKETNQETNISS